MSGIGWLFLLRIAHPTTRSQWVGIGSGAWFRQRAVAAHGFPIALHRQTHYFRQVHETYLVARFFAFDAVLEHGGAEGARGSEGGRACIQRVLHAVLVHAPPDVLLHPHAAAASPA